MKICCDCGILKPLSDFYKLKNGWIYKRCKVCYLDKYSPNRGKPNTGRFKKGNIPLTRKKIDGKQSNRTKEWCKAVKERDNYECQYCKSKEKLHAHHIKKWKEHRELRFNLNNGLTLCSSCHAVLHGKENCNLLKNGTSWIKGKKLSKEYIQKLSDAHKGKKLSEETKIKISKASKGRKHTEETKRKLSEIHKGMKHTFESRKKMCESRKGKPSHRKGKKHTPEAIKKMRKSHKNQIPWNKDKKTGQIPWNKGKKMSEEYKENHKGFNKGNIPWNKGLKDFMKGRIVSEKTKKKMSESAKLRYEKILAGDIA